MEGINKTFNKKKAITAASAGAVAVATLIAGSFAFFTDREQVDSRATAAKINIDLDAPWTDEVLLPGQIVDLPSTITSTGNRAIDVRETFVLTSDVALSNVGAAEFEIYKVSDLEMNAFGAYIPIDGAEPITTGANRVLSDDGKTLTYTLPEFIMSGGGETPSGTVGTEVSKDYVALFKLEASDAYQKAEVKVDYIVEAKQHSATNADDWAVLATHSIENVSGSYVAPAGSN